MTRQPKKDKTPFYHSVHALSKKTHHNHRGKSASSRLPGPNPKKNQSDVLGTLLKKHALSVEFPATVQSKSTSFGLEVPQSSWQKRETFFHVPVFTIDGPDAKDFDDAVSLESRSNGGWRLGVHIADASHYVAEGSVLDKEAFKRGTSVYLLNTVVPMLPCSLSAGLCSLRPHVVRLTLSCVMDLDTQGRVVSYRIMESAIRSAKRFTYDDVDAILKGKGNGGASPAIANTVNAMGKVARVLRHAREKRGALDFDAPEPVVVFDKIGQPVHVRKQERLESHRLIEEFMLLANETVAKDMRAYPFLYRVHDKPDKQRISKLEEMLKSVGMTVPKELLHGRVSALQSVLASAKGLPIQPMVQMMVMRTLNQAVYSSANIGHFGLASPCYTHFTSPIRRYPDLIVHRILKERLRGVLNGKRHAYWKTRLPKIALWSSARERAAVDAEREYTDQKKVQVMEKHVGDIFNGIVTGVTGFGFFVQLNDIFVEGLVHVSNIGGDYYVFDKVRSQLRGRRTGRVFRMGTHVRVQVAAARSMKKQLDFELL